MIYDLAIIGAGPAGITAAIYAARKKLKVLVIAENIGGQAALSGSIQNYTGYQFISGQDLALKFEEHLKSFQIDLKEFERVECIKKIKDIISIKTPGFDYLAYTVIIATGRTPKKLNIQGEDQFKNKGITYCATCDGPLFADKDVAIIGGGNSALDTTLQLISIAKKIYVISIQNSLSGDPIIIDKVIASDKVTILNNSKPVEFYGAQMLEGIKIKTADNKIETLPVQGAFIEIGSLATTTSICAELELNVSGEIIVNTRCETNVTGIFAAGDVTDIPAKQIITAAGQGCIASLSAFDYLAKLQKKEENKMDKYICNVCGYIYDPAQNNNIAFENLPADWVCPECGVGKDQFSILS